MKKLNKKGFTLAELLIVVAIIAVLAAIAIPIFTAQLDKAKVAADEANIRSGYAAVSTEVLSNTTSTVTTYKLSKDATVSADGTATTPFVAQIDGTADIGGQTVTWKKDQGITYTVDRATNKITIAAAAGN